MYNNNEERWLTSPYDIVWFLYVYLRTLFPTWNVNGKMFNRQFRIDRLMHIPSATKLSRVRWKTWTQNDSVFLKSRHCRPKQSDRLWNKKQQHSENCLLIFMKNCSVELSLTLCLTRSWWNFFGHAFQKELQTSLNTKQISPLEQFVWS